MSQNRPPNPFSMRPLGAFREDSTPVRGNYKKRPYGGFRPNFAEPPRYQFRPNKPHRGGMSFPPTRTHLGAYAGPESFVESGYYQPNMPPPAAEIPESDSTQKMVAMFNHLMTSNPDFARQFMQSTVTTPTTTTDMSSVLPNMPGSTQNVESQITQHTPPSVSTPVVTITPPITSTVTTSPNITQVSTPATNTTVVTATNITQVSTAATNTTVSTSPNATQVSTPATNTTVVTSPNITQVSTPVTNTLVVTSQQTIANTKSIGVTATSTTTNVINTTTNSQPTSTAVNTTSSPSAITTVTATTSPVMSASVPRTKPKMNLQISIRSDAKIESKSLSVSSSSAPDPPKSILKQKKVTFGDTETSSSQKPSKSDISNVKNYSTGDDSVNLSNMAYYTSGIGAAGNGSGDLTSYDLSALNSQATKNLYPGGQAATASVPSMQGLSLAPAPGMTYNPANQSTKPTLEQMQSFLTAYPNFANMGMYAQAPSPHQQQAVTPPQQQQFPANQAAPALQAQAATPQPQPPQQSVPSTQFQYQPSPPQATMNTAPAPPQQQQAPIMQQGIGATPKMNELGFASTVQQSQPVTNKAPRSKDTFDAAVKEFKQKDAGKIRGDLSKYQYKQHFFPRSTFKKTCPGGYPDCRAFDEMAIRLNETIDRFQQELNNIMSLAKAHETLETYLGTVSGLGAASLLIKADLERKLVEAYEKYMDELYQWYHEQIRLFPIIPIEKKIDHLGQPSDFRWDVVDALLVACSEFSFDKAFKK